VTREGDYVFAVAAAQDSGRVHDTADVAPSFGPIRTVPVGDVVAYVSTYTGPEVEAMPQNELPAFLLSHQSVIEKLMRVTPVLPVRLGTVLSDDEQVASALRTSNELLRDSIDAFAGTVEVDVAATWNLPEVLAGVALEPDVQAAKEAASQSSSTSRQEAMIKVGQLVEARLAALRDQLESVILERLRPLARDVQLNPVVSDELVCNVALLIDKSSASEIDDSLRELDAELQGKYDFRRVGPLPPYSFASVHLHTIGADDIARALHVLSLAEVGEAGVVDDAFRRLALSQHPDVKGSDGGSAHEFEDLVWARNTLLSALEHRPNDTLPQSIGVSYATVERSMGRI